MVTGEGLERVWKIWLTLPRKRDTLLKFGAVARVSRIVFRAEGCRDNRLESANVAMIQSVGLMQCSCIRPMQHNLCEEAAAFLATHA